MNDMTPFQGVPNPVPENDGLDDAYFFQMMLPGGLDRFTSLTDYMRVVGWAIVEIGSLTLDYGETLFESDFGPYNGDRIGHSLPVGRRPPSVKVTPKTHANIGDNRLVACRYQLYEPVFISHAKQKKWGVVSEDAWTLYITAGITEKIPLVDIFKTLQKRDPVLWNLGL